MAKEDIQSGYQETFADFIQASRTEDHCSGPCRIDDASEISTSLQLFPYVKHCLHACTDAMKPLFELLKVKTEDKCVFYNKAESITTLLKQLTSTAPRSFTYNSISGAQSDDAILMNDEDSDNELPPVNPDELVARKIE